MPVERVLWVCWVQGGSKERRIGGQDNHLNIVNKGKAIEQFWGVREAGWAAIPG